MVKGMAFRRHEYPCMDWAVWQLQQLSAGPCQRIQRTSNVAPPATHLGRRIWKDRHGIAHFFVPARGGPDDIRPSERAPCTFKLVRSESGNTPVHRFPTSTSFILSNAFKPHLFCGCSCLWNGENQNKTWPLLDKFFLSLSPLVEWSLRAR